VVCARCVTSAGAQNVYVVDVRVRAYFYYYLKSWSGGSAEDGFMIIHKVCWSS